MISDKSVFSHRKMSIDGASHEALVLYQDLMFRLWTLLKALQPGDL
jgi:hypothetical protein